MIFKTGICEKCGSKDGTEIGTLHPHFLCDNCREKWSVFFRPHDNEFRKTHIGNTEEFHVFWEKSMQDFLRDGKVKVEFT